MGTPPLAAPLVRVRTAVRKALRAGVAATQRGLTSGLAHHAYVQQTPCTRALPPLPETQPWRPLKGLRPVTAAMPYRWLSLHTVDLQLPAPRRHRYPEHHPMLPTTMLLLLLLLLRFLLLVMPAPRRLLLLRGRLGSMRQRGGLLEVPGPQLLLHAPHQARHVLDAHGGHLGSGRQRQNDKGETMSDKEEQPILGRAVLGQDT